MSDSMPKYVTVIKSITYDTQEILNSLTAQGHESPDFDDVVGMVEEFAKDDFSCGWGHGADIKDLIFQTSDGDEL